jgi:YD repeat-containing protein
LQRPDLANLVWTYTDATPPTQSSVSASVPVQGSNVQKTVTNIDGFGRPVTQQITDGTTNYSTVQTQYDPLGRPYKSTTPYISTQYWNTTQFDTLGRATVAILPDNSQSTFSYAASSGIATIQVTDPVLKVRKYQVDGLGRITSVWEPDPLNSNSLTLQSSYSYNVFDLLMGVTQGSQSRTYAYDELGRVTSLKTPETNQVAAQFLYNNFSLVTQRTDPRGVVTTYGYDTYNRPQSISYNVGTTGVTATPSIGFTYGANQAQFNNGRTLTKTDGVGSETYSYNNLGRLTGLQKVISGTTYPLS